MAFWTGLRVQPILSDEVQTFKALITVHKVLQEGHPVVCLLIDYGELWSLITVQTIKEAHGQTGWLETCARTVNSDGMRGETPFCTPSPSSHLNVQATAP